MSKPESIKVDPWTEWPRQSYSLINDDFVHDKLATFKVNAKGSKSTVNLKANIKADKGGLKLSDEVKYWFGLPEGRSFYSKVKSSDYIKLHLDNGIVEKWNRKWNLYATLNLTKTLSNASLRLGANHVSSKCSSDNRLRVDFQDDKQNLTWYNRTVVTKDKVTFGNMFVYNISSQILSKTNFLLGYKVSDKIDAFVRVENNDYRKVSWSPAEIVNHFDTCRLDFIAKHDDRIKYGLEVSMYLYRPFSRRKLDRAPSTKHFLLFNMMTRKIRELQRLDSVQSSTSHFHTNSHRFFSRILQQLPSEFTDQTSITTKEASRLEDSSNSMFDHINKTLNIIISKLIVLLELSLKNKRLFL